MCVKWMHTVYIKQQNWWDHHAPSTASWVVKNLCKVKEDLKSMQVHTWANNSCYKINDLYKMMMDDDTSAPWAKVVWNRMSVPKHKFIMWLGVQDRLQTKGRLHKFGVCQDDICCICGLVAEIGKYLFFECSYSTQLIQVLMRWIGITPRSRSLA